MQTSNFDKITPQNPGLLLRPLITVQCVDQDECLQVATVGADLSASVSAPYSLNLAISPPVSPVSPPIREAHPDLSPAAATTAQEVGPHF